MGLADKLNKLLIENYKGNLNIFLLVFLYPET